jgi:cyclic pyranopterin phosphate synthase
MKIFAFEEIGADLRFLPLAARRALDRAGIKISLEAWLAMDLSARRALVREGSAGRVDADRVEKIIARAGVPLASIDKVPEPRALPPNLRETLGAERWRDLTPIARYALIKASQKGGERLRQATEEIMGTSWSNHLASDGTVRMVNVGDKEATARRAVAQARVEMQRATFDLLSRGETPKGDALATARIAGIQAAKRTSELIPLCHNITLTKVDITIELRAGGATIQAAAEARDRTGVEMEAMVAASTAALTLYDMLKGIDRGIAFTVQLLEKRGGKSGTWTRRGAR